MLSEPVRVLVVVPVGQSVKLIGKGLNTSQVHEPIISQEQPATLEVTPEKEPFDSDAKRFRLGVEAIRLGLAYEYDPYFSLSITRMDPLPHQLEVDQREGISKQKIDETKVALRNWFERRLAH